jgi:hypothetical protein
VFFSVVLDCSLDVSALVFDCGWVSWLGCMVSSSRTKTVDLRCKQLGTNAANYRCIVIWFRIIFSL